MDVPFSPGPSYLPSTAFGSSGSASPLGQPSFHFPPNDPSCSRASEALPFPQTRDGSVGGRSICAVPARGATARWRSRPSSGGICPVTTIDFGIVPRTRRNRKFSGIRPVTNDSSQGLRKKAFRQMTANHGG